MAPYMVRGTIHCAADGPAGPDMAPWMVGAMDGAMDGPRGDILWLLWKVAIFIVSFQTLFSEYLKNHSDFI